MAQRLLRCVVGALTTCAVLAPAGLGTAAQADAASPTVSGPVTGGGGIPLVFSSQPADALNGSPVFDLASVGYTQSEFFVEGTADAYSPTSALTTDGHWSVQPSSQAAYKTRVVVNRPMKARDFNGTVVVEWLNVSGGADASPDWGHTHVELIRRGFAWVGVSAQAVGVNQLKCPDPPLPTCPGSVAGPRPGDAARYGSLNHPGDSYSYDMFSQAGQAIRDNAGLVLGGLRPERLIAAGESQSAGRLATYIDAVHPLVEVYDGFLVHSRGAGSAPLSQAPLPIVPVPVPTLIRDDLAPVLSFQTETDVAGAIAVGGLAARQPDSSRFRLWEVAGTAHFDLYGLQTALTDTGRRQSVAAWFDSMRNPSNQIGLFTCASPINSGPQTFVLRSATSHLARWVDGGAPPPEAPRLEVASAAPFAFALDANGNVRGGIRTPAVDAPVATLGGLGQTGSPFCSLFGTTTPFTQQQLDTLYRNHGSFVVRWSAATFKALAAGFIRREDAVNMLAVGAQADIP
ncbi:MAG TPA: alpha/beta hydrolase domain-containing protein [Acidimicrobiales bacterium]|nr:alpha/beta hydrolase domain-containing protein [Acidimicrobiales bacterium]